MIICMSFTASSHGGEYKHKLTVAEMPSHNHSRGTYESSYEASGYGLTRNSVAFADRALISCKNCGDTGDKGGDGYHNNLPPYITIFFWRRTA